MVAPAVDGLTDDVLRAGGIDMFVESPAGHAVLRRDGTLLRVNDRLAGWLGLAPDALRGRRISELLTPGSRAVLETYALAILSATGTVEEVALDLDGPGGTRLATLVNMRLGPTASDGTPLLVATILRAESRSTYERELVEQRTRVAEANEKLRAVFEHFPGGITFVDADLNMLGCNDTYRKMHDLPERLFADGLPNLRDVFRFNAERGEYGPGDIDEIVRSRVDRALIPTPHIFERTRLNGSVLEIRGMPMTGGGFVTTYLDVTERQRTQALILEKSRLAEQKSRELEITMAHMNQGVSVFDRDCRLVTWNQRYIELFEMAPEDVFVGVTLHQLLAVQARNGNFRGDIGTYIDGIATRVSAGQENRATARMNSGRIVHTIHCPAPEGGWVSTHEDVTERELAAERVVFAAHHDILTGLTNRAGLKSRLQSLPVETRADDVRFSILMVDLDRFKAVNDTFGHGVGDRLLQLVADRMRGNVRADDIIARLGGDEFAVYYATSADQLAGSVALAERLRAVLSAPYDIDGRQIVIGASIGIAVAPQHGISLDDLMHSADAALYEVKETGRGAVRIFDDALERIARDRRELEHDLRRALADDELELHYQPVVRVSDRAVVGMEALLRWHHPTRGLVGPDAFIPIAEQTGLIGPIGDWVLRTACADAMDWPAHISLAVNVSVAQLGSADFVRTVTAELLRTRLDPRRLELEVTESVLLNDDVTLLDDLHALRRLGVRIALDDFGTGHSSLSYLRLFPFDKIKIDRSFVRDIRDNRHCAAIVAAIAGLALSLDVSTTAEGVETEDQFALVAAAGCATVQGYLFDRARPKRDIRLDTASEQRRSV